MSPLLKLLPVADDCRVAWAASKIWLFSALGALMLANSSACMLEVSHDESVASVQQELSLGDTAASLSPGELINLFPRLRIHTCDRDDAQSADPVWLITQYQLKDQGVTEPNTGLTFYPWAGHTLSLKDAALARNKWAEYYLTDQVPVDLSFLRSLVIKKRGNDPWCVDKVELLSQGRRVWYYDASRNDVGASYFGPAKAGEVLWINDNLDRSSIRFADYFIGKGTVAQMRPLELEVRTCAATTATHPQTDDPVSIRLERDFGIMETLILDNIGNDREAGQTDRYVLDEQGVRSVRRFTLEKKGGDRWCFDRVRLFAGGKMFFETSGTFLVDDDARDAPSQSKQISVDLTLGGTASTSGYPGLPLQRSVHWTVGQGSEGQECRKAGVETNRCNKGLACYNNKCVPSGYDDEPCNDAVGVALCSSGLDCINSFCREPGEEYGRCFDGTSGCNDGLVCEDEQCFAPSTLYGPFGGDITCTYGDVDCNRCAIDVVRQFKDTFTTSQNLSYGWLDEQKLPPGNSAMPYEDPPFSHVQSFVRLPLDRQPSDPVWFAGAFAPDDHATIWFTRFGAEGTLREVGGTGSVAALFRAPSDHPGGMQGIGRYLVVAREVEGDESDNNYFDIYNASEPTKASLHGRINTNTLTGVKRTASVGVGRTDDGGYLFFANYSSTSESGEYTYYTFRADDLKGSGFELLDTYTEEDGSENLSVVTDCSGRMYAIGSTASTERNRWSLYELGPERGKGKLRVAFSEEPTRSSKCNARASGTVFVARDGGLHFYCHEKNWVQNTGGGNLQEHWPAWL